MDNDFCENICQREARIMLNASQLAMKMIDNSGVRNHMLSEAAGTHTSEEESNEIRMFRDYLITRNGCLVMAMEGHE